MSLNSPEIGKELILPEFPLTIRLIGLRVTKLKDLRASLDPVNGIKRFFGTLQDSQPHKRPKIGDVDADADTAETHELLDATSDESMPGFLEMDEGDHAIYELEDNFVKGSQANVDDTGHVQNSLPPTRIPGVTTTQILHQFAPTPGTSTATINRPSTIKLHSSGRKFESNPDRLQKASNIEEVHDCPVCERSLQTDNQGLNAHIDFCLSRGAIRQAHAEATSPVKPSLLGFKPINKGKRKSKG
ncbi:hypothetical protein H0H87_003755 [Tephrocybe sp. NHM501043]|nr:hypothetical protein H0H87_003755 [Tephrocybe sp. NHM501043]